MAKRQENGQHHSHMHFSIQWQVQSCARRSSPELLCTNPWVDLLFLIVTSYLVFANVFMFLMGL